MSAVSDRQPRIPAPETEWTLERILQEFPDLKGMPEAVLLQSDPYDMDCAGGCG